MSHVRNLTLDPAADPIHAAIDRHRFAWAAAMAASGGVPAVVAHDDYTAATDVLVATACTTRFGALALLAHLLLWIEHEAEFAAGHQPAYRLAQARAADLTLFLGTNLPPVAIPHAFPSGRMPTAPVRPLPAADRYHRAAALAPPDEALPGEIEPWQAVAAIWPDTAFVRGRRFMDAAGELLAALVIIGGGCVLTGLASIL